ncbi:IPTL-CTERM sorting domain-containing protein [Comamonas odontotermitis]|uniref:IPTL-CTERM sorting domain-containing protein n=1 Tax=Comamonas odontotermitis TaxID=379895 RepID=UPI001CC4051D|nr:IPTL-CTERM sorting domain-containing protein [Comamonas odontotermitis]UBB18380.1 IPTL-CTERM sorting domain-containing protein [Comamonas odontotermitis]
MSLLSHSWLARSLIKLALPALLTLGMLAAPARAQSIDTTQVGYGGVGAFGKSFTHTYGQTITAPAQAAVLHGFSIRMSAPSSGLPFKFYVYAWDDTSKRATGPALYVGAEQMTTANQFYGVTGLNISLVPDQKYVLFASVLETSWPAQAGAMWGFWSSDIYPGGNFVYGFDATTVSELTTNAWEQSTSGDLAFTAEIAYTSLPIAPNLSLASRGDSQATFTVNASDSGAYPLKHYAVSCTPQGGDSSVSATGASSPITVTGLTNGTTYDCTATVTNQGDITGPASAVVSVTPISEPVITVPSTLAGRINQLYSVTLQATGGVAPYNWSASGLPANLTIDPVSGIISGTPTAAGTSQVTVTVADDASQVKNTSFAIVIDPLDLTIPADGQALPAGQVGQAYSARIVVAGGVPPYSFTLSGALPDGLTLDPVTGAITGTPTKAQTSNFSITISDSTQVGAASVAKAAVNNLTQSYSIMIAAEPVVTPTPTPVPTLGLWSVISLSSLLAVFGLVRGRRRSA